MKQVKIKDVKVLDGSIVLSSSDEYKKIRALFELFGYVVVGNVLTWEQVDEWLLHLVYQQKRDVEEIHACLYVQEFWRNAYNLCLTAVQYGINEFDEWPYE